MGTFANVSDEHKQRFNEALGGITKSPEHLGDLCGEIVKIGMPDYYPSYMILHGIKAFSGNPHEGSLSRDFDGPGTWRKLQSDYLHCPA